MLKKDDILAALKKIGPCAPADLAKQLGVEGPALRYHLKPLIEGGEVKAAGNRRGLRIALPDQKLDAAADSPTPPQHRRKARKPKRKSKERKTRRAHKTSLARTAERFLPTVDVASRLVIVNGGEPIIFDEPQTSAIAALLFQHYDKA
jgi:DNA-binding transcriptional ArsR family regulator